MDRSILDETSHINMTLLLVKIASLVSQQSSKR